ncbi:MAG: 6-pyruvoyl trahydropterin synthase family protein [Fimbriimonadaceae bacterium]
MSQNQPITITKEYRWEMGHRLSTHTEGCQNLHGHSYRLVVALTGTNNSDGMVFDFGDISRIVRPIIEHLDHSTMLHQDDQPLVEFLQGQGMKLTLTPFHPTTEELGQWLLTQIADQIGTPANIQDLSITLYETATSTVTLSRTLS